ncbi:MAG TPA: aldo/keto reductase [Longimicrobium sp.]|nr:aldo/keto reductase [Longimicrobium sp.]
MQQVQMGRTGWRVTRIGLGGMPLSIPGRPDREDAKQVIRRAVELGVNFIDTADVYCMDESDVGHNERLIAETLDELGVRDDVLVATKGGLIRPEGRWEQDGRPQQLRRACEHSLRMLDTDRISLYQLHAPDPRVPFADSMGEMARLYEEGKVGAVGLSNVSLMQLQAAQAIVPVTSVQNRFNPWDRAAELEGVIRYCDQNSITFLPYSPVGGRRRVPVLRESEDLRAIGERHGGASPEELVLAWMLGVSPSLVPIPGAKRVASIESSVRSAALHLDDRTRRELEEAFRALPEEGIA